MPDCLRGIAILFEQGLLRWKLQSHLDLVASRDKVQGRPVLKFPDGKSPIERLRAVYGPDDASHVKRIGLESAGSSAAPFTSAVAVTL